MRGAVTAFRDAWRDYRRHFRELSIASALLAVPMAVVEFLRGPVPPPDHGLSFSLLSGMELAIAAASIRVLTPAAVALLAADVRAGGTGGWRQAWGRAFSRIDVVVTGRSAVGAFFVGLLFLALVLAKALLREHDAPLWRFVAACVVIIPGLVAWASFALVPIVTAVGGMGGLEALAEIGRVLRRDPLSKLATLLLAQALAVLPTLILLFVALGPPERWAYVSLAYRLYDIAVMPFVTLVALSVYRPDRQSG